MPSSAGSQAMYSSPLHSVIGTSSSSSASSSSAIASMSMTTMPLSSSVSYNSMSSHSPPTSYPCVPSPSPGNVISHPSAGSQSLILGHHHHHPHLHTSSKFVSPSATTPPEAHKYLPTTAEHFPRSSPAAMESSYVGDHQALRYSSVDTQRGGCLSSGGGGDLYRQGSEGVGSPHPRLQSSVGGEVMQGRYTRINDIDNDTGGVGGGGQYHRHQTSVDYRSSNPMDLQHRGNEASQSIVSNNRVLFDPHHRYNSSSQRHVTEALRSPPPTPVSIDRSRCSDPVDDGSDGGMYRHLMENSSQRSSLVDDYRSSPSSSQQQQYYRVVDQIRSSSESSNERGGMLDTSSRAASEISQRIVNTLRTSGTAATERLPNDLETSGLDNGHHRPLSEASLRSNVDAQRMVQESLRMYFPSVNQSPNDGNVRTVIETRDGGGNSEIFSYQLPSSQTRGLTDTNGRYQNTPDHRAAMLDNNSVRSGDPPSSSQIHMETPAQNLHMTGSDPSQLVPENLCLSEPVSQSGISEQFSGAEHSVNVNSIVDVNRNRLPHHQQVVPSVPSHILHPPPPESPMPPSVLSHPPESPLPPMMSHPPESPMPLLHHYSHPPSHGMVEASMTSGSLNDHLPPDSPMPTQHMMPPRPPESPMPSHVFASRPLESPMPHHVSDVHPPESPMPSQQHHSHHRHSLNLRPTESPVPQQLMVSSRGTNGSAAESHVLFSRVSSSTESLMLSPRQSAEAYVLSSSHRMSSESQARETASLMLASSVRDNDYDPGAVENLLSSRAQDYPLPSMRSHYDPVHRIHNESTPVTSLPAHHLVRDAMKYSPPDSMKFDPDGVKFTTDSSPVKFSPESMKFSADSMKFNSDSVAKFNQSDTSMKFNATPRYLEGVYRGDLQQPPNSHNNMGTPDALVQSPMPADPSLSQYYSSAYSPHSSSSHVQQQQQFASYAASTDSCIDRDGMIIDDKFDRIYQDVKPFDQEYPISMHATHEFQQEAPAAPRPPKPKKPKEPKPPRVPVVHICKECNRVFKNSTQLKNHMWRHTGEKPFTCDQCGSKFTQQGNLRAHRRIHTGERPYECSVCKHCFTQLSTLKTHQKIHSDERPHKCTLCEAAFRQVANLKTHQVTHTGERPHKCEMCDKAFTQKSNLKAHRNRVHNPDGSFSANSRRGRKKNPSAIKPFSCVECGAKFTMMSNLKIHMKLHTGTRNYNCDMCGAAFSHRTNLKTHVQRMHSCVRKRLKCDECPASFRLKRCLKAHKRKRHPIKSLKIKILGESKYFMRERSGPGLSEDIDESLLEEAEEGEDRSYIQEPIIQIREPKQEPADPPASPTLALPREPMDYFGSVPGEEHTPSTSTQFKPQHKHLTPANFVKEEVGVNSSSTCSTPLTESNTKTSALKAVAPTKDDANQTNICSSDVGYAPPLVAENDSELSCAEDAETSLLHETDAVPRQGGVAAPVRCNESDRLAFCNDTVGVDSTKKLYAPPSPVPGDLLVSPNNTSAMQSSCGSPPLGGHIENPAVSNSLHVDATIANEVDNAINLVENIVNHLDSNIGKHSDHNFSNSCNNNMNISNNNISFGSSITNDVVEAGATAIEAFSNATGNSSSGVLLPLSSVATNNNVSEAFPSSQGCSKDMSYVTGTNVSIEKVTQQLTVHLERLTEEFKICNAAASKSLPPEQQTLMGGDPPTGQYIGARGGGAILEGPASPYSPAEQWPKQQSATVEDKMVSSDEDYTVAENGHVAEYRVISPGQTDPVTENSSSSSCLELASAAASPLVQQEPNFLPLESDKHT